jgi:ABC-type multidrug transport system fused ATPase/permease subunit
MTHLIRLLFYARSQWWRLFVGLAGAIVEMVLALMVPLYTKRVIDRLADPGSSPEVAYGFLNIVAVALLARDIALRKRRSLNISRKIGSLWVRLKAKDESQPRELSKSMRV